MLSWLPANQVKSIVNAAGFDEASQSDVPVSEREAAGIVTSNDNFKLPGRPELESFLNEHVIDIVRNAERYKALGIGFPSAIILHGPPGCGKTFAVEKLVEFLGWPSFQIDASSIGSPYIHETSRKVAVCHEYRRSKRRCATV